MRAAVSNGTPRNESVPSSRSNPEDVSYSRAKNNKYKRKRKSQGRDEPCEEVPEIDEFAVSFVFDVDDTPAVLATTYGFAVNDDVAFRTDDCKGNHVLYV